MFMQSVKGIISGATSETGYTEFWSNSFTGPGSFVPYTERLGFQFTVGGTSLVCNTLSVYLASTTDENVRIHRVSDGALIAEATITDDTTGVWIDATVTNFVLAAGESYTCSSRGGGTARNYYRNQTGVSVYPGITKTANVWGTSDNLPTNTLPTLFMTCRFGYVGGPPIAAFDDVLAATQPYAYWDCQHNWTNDGYLADQSGNGHNLDVISGGPSVYTNPIRSTKTQCALWGNAGEIPAHSVSRASNAYWFRDPGGVELENAFIYPGDTNISKITLTYAWSQYTNVYAGTQTFSKIIGFRDSNTYMRMSANTSYPSGGFVGAEFRVATNRSTPAAYKYGANYLFRYRPQIVTLRYDGSTGKWAHFVQGVKLSEGTDATYNSILYNATSFFEWPGTMSGAYASYGRSDFAGIHNEALSDEDIIALHNAYENEIIFELKDYFTGDPNGTDLESHSPDIGSSSWKSFNGTIEILNGTAQGQQTGGAVGVYVIDAGSEPVYVSAKITFNTTPTTTPSNGVLLRASWTDGTPLTSMSWVLVGIWEADDLSPQLQIHTYDQDGAGWTLRAAVSLLSRGPLTGTTRLIEAIDTGERIAARVCFGATEYVCRWTTAGTSTNTGVGIRLSDDNQLKEFEVLPFS